MTRYSIEPGFRRNLRLPLLASAMLIGVYAQPSFGFYPDPGGPVPDDHGPPLPVPLPDPPIPSSKVNLLGFMLFKGDLHNHARGHGDLGHAAPRRSAQSIFQMARATGGDFLAITNHDISTTNGTTCPGGEVLPPAWPIPIPYPTLYECWKHNPWTLDWLTDIDTNDALAAAPANTDDNFVALVGYERTGVAWNHLNVFNMPEWIFDGNPLAQGDVAGNIAGVRSRINEGKDPIITINHPDPTMWNGLAFDPVMATKTHLLEMQHASDEEMAQFPLEPLSPTNVKSFKLALANGWKVSPVANSDTHSGYASTSFPGDFRAFDVRTGIALPAGMPLTQENLFDAMKQHRTFASSSPYLSAMFTAGFQPMGSTVLGTAPLPFVLNALYAIPAGAPGDWRNICNIELWTSGNPQQPLRTFAGYNQTFVDLFFTLNTPFFKDYFFKVNARSNCANQAEPWATLFTAPVWTAGQMPKPTVTAPSTGITVTPGSAVTLQWSGSALIANVKVQAYRTSGMVPQGDLPPMPNSGQVTLSTAGWPNGTYVVGISDTQYPGFEWRSKTITVADPPPPPPEPPCGRYCQ